MQVPNKILFVIPSLQIGGTEMHLAQVLPMLKEHGWQITIALTSSTGPIAKQLARQGIKIIPPGKIQQYMHKRSKLLRAPLLLLTIIKLCRILKQEKPDLVQFMLPEAYILGGISALLVGQKNLIMSRRSLNNYQKKYPIISKVEHWLHQKTRFVIANSQTTLKQLRELEKIGTEKLKLVYNGITLHTPKNIARNFTMVVVANIIPYKGHITLLHALTTIKNQLPENWQLLCVGRKDPYWLELAQVCEDLNLQDHIQWIGSCDNVQPFLNSAHIAISCSYEEGFSNSILEAMAAELPVIATDVGGNPEAVIDNVTGIIVPAKDIDALAAAIIQLYKNPQQRKSMGAAGRKRIEENFTLEKCVDAYNQLYLEILN